MQLIQILMGMEHLMLKIPIQQTHVLVSMQVQQVFHGKMEIVMGTEFLMAQMPMLMETDQQITVPIPMATELTMQMIQILMEMVF